ncbi:uncharacterized protein V6R79_022974 [Siganus canaliculatus]
MGLRRYEDIHHVIRFDDKSTRTLRLETDHMVAFRGHNITMDNFFTSAPLAEKLLKKNLTIVGTLRQKKPDIPPPIMKPSKSQKIHSHS